MAVTVVFLARSPQDYEFKSCPGIVLLQNFYFTILILSPVQYNKRPVWSCTLDTKWRSIPNIDWLVATLFSKDRTYRRLTDLTGAARNVVLKI